MSLSPPPVYHVGTLTYTKSKLAVLFCWLLWGDFCYMLMETVVPSILPLKFRALGASNVAIGVILTTLPMVINTVASPSSSRDGRPTATIPCASSCGA
ncbi:MAG: hypothetical protein WC708_02275 [Lentisphaeria bacterium]